METPKGVEVTIRKSQAAELIFIINHNFAPATVSLDGKYKDIIKTRELQGNVLVEPQHTLILEKII